MCETMLAKLNFYTKIWQRITEDNVPEGKLKKNYEKNNFFASLKSLKKGVGSAVGSRPGSRSRSIRQGYGSADPDPHQKCHGSPTPAKSQRFFYLAILSVHIWHQLMEAAGEGGGRYL
jgi:hypothetical protein